MYEIALKVSEECLLDRWSYPSNIDLLRSMLINEGVSGSLQAYYELVHDNDLYARAGGFFYIGNALGDTNKETYSFGTSRTKASWPIVFGQYLYNRSTARRYG